MKRFASGGLLAAAILLVSAQSALAWPDDATAQLSSTPAGTTAGEAWDVDVSFVTKGQVLTVDNLQPIITIHERATGRDLSFAATSTGQTGIYHARVVFPSAGEWTYTVRSARAGAVFQFPSYRITPAVATGPGFNPAPASSPIALYVVLLLAAALTVVMLGRRLVGADARTA
jgi:hypothetical protein